MHTQLLLLLRSYLAHVAIIGFICASNAAHSQPSGGPSGEPDPSGIEFVNIGAVGNSPWQGNGSEGDRFIGRECVDYIYNIGKYEVTTA